MTRGAAAGTVRSSLGRKRPQPESSEMRKAERRGQRALGNFAEGGKVGVLFGDTGPRLVDANRGLEIRAGFVHVTQLTMITS